MSVKKKITPSINNFIDNGAHVKANRDKSFKNILIRVPACILTDLDDWIEKKPWINRTQWIVESIYEKLNRDCT